ncbi:MAG: hypothetical protein ACREI9_16445 [Nitrospiraceae bacterium]
MHKWGDTTVDWFGISAAAEFIGEGLRLWRVDVHQYKEKYGTVRVYCILGLFSWNQLTHPGYSYNKWPHFVVYPGRYSLFRLGLWTLNLVVRPFHEYLYRYYYIEACRRWPHLRREILDAADYPELLEGLNS